jgi:hypothetical protein
MTLRPPYPSSAYPRVERREGLICVQTLADSGQVEESCRREEGTGRAAPLRVPSSGPVEEVNEPPRSRSRSRRAAREQEQEPEEPAARFVLDALVHGGLQVLATTGGIAALPQLSGTLDLGARFRAGVGVVALLNLAAGFASSGGDVLFTAAPGLRLGDRSHFILALGPGFFGYSGRGGSGSGAVFSLITQGVFAVGSVFAFTLQGAAHFDASGVIFVLGAGLGFGAF